MSLSPGMLRITVTYREQAEAALAMLDIPEPEKLSVPTVAEEIDLPAPQAGPQTVACESPAQIIIYGGRAGGGKTWWLLREAMRHHDNALHRALLLRRTTAQATKPGALWDESSSMYRAYGVQSRSNKLDHRFPSGATVTIGHCEHERNRYDWDGSQLTFVGFDQVEQFTEAMFWYIALSRSRTMSGLPTRIGATANPVNPQHKTGGWLARLLMRGGWVDSKTGYAVPEMSGVIRWFYRDKGEVQFFETPEEAKKAFPDKARRGALPISFTFIEARLEDNKMLEERDPGYRSNLEALTWIDRLRLLEGNWKVSTAGGGYVRREWYRLLEHDPQRAAKQQPRAKGFYKASVRAWDIAASDATQREARDRTASVLESRAEDSGRFVVREQMAGRWGPRQVRDMIAETMLRDGPNVRIRLPQDPAAGGKYMANDIVLHLRKVAAAEEMRLPKIVVKPVRGKKAARGMAFRRDSEPVALTADGEVSIFGNVDIVKGPHTEEFLEELHHFDGSDGAADDFWDAVSDAHDELVLMTTKKHPGVY